MLMKAQSGVKYFVSFFANKVLVIFLKNPAYLKSPMARNKKITPIPVLP
jgi:hypothetical protein